MRDIQWTPCCIGPNTFTIYRGHKVTRTQYMGTIVEPIDTETCLPITYKQRGFPSPGPAFDYIDEGV